MVKLCDVTRAESHADSDKQVSETPMFSILLLGLTSLLTDV